MLGFNGGRLGSKNVIEQNGIVSPSSDPDYDDVGLILNGGDFVDGSKYAATVTATGVDLSTTQNFNRDSYSVLDNDVFSVPDQGQFDLSTNNFTIEGWVYRYSASSNNTFRNIFGKRRGSGGAVRYLYFTLYTGNRFFLYGTSNGSSWDIANAVDTGVALGADTWTHYAVCRQGSSIRIFIAGTLATTITTTASIINDSTAPFQIGTDGSANAFDGGRLAGIRVTNGTARYTANFTPPTAIFDAGTTGFKASGVWTIPEVSRLRRTFVWPGDNPLVLAGLSLYLDAGDTNSYPGTGTTWTDLSGNGNNGTLINMDGANFDSANGGSLTFNGTNEYVSETSSLSDSFWQGNWTASFWVNFDTLGTATTGADDRPLLQHGSNATRKGLHLTQRNTRIHFGLYGDDLQGTEVLSTGTWYNVVYTLDNSNYAKQIYLNGVLDNSHTGGGAYTGTGTNTRIGGKVLSFGSLFDGFMSSCNFYNRVLTDSEVTQNFDFFKGRFGL